ncbi:MAG TPA: SRPBCC domain-containing protein [Acidimicrobiales bacterium]|jgi:uncharacterized protein YndB with AHSA1/START domain|nr:SRPBCC domain-containing protein [Acidimicrobiales bacterium]
MPDITHHFGFAAPKADVFEALATVEGLTSWWAERVEGDPSPGGTLRFYFGNPGPAATMQVVESDPDTGVKWRCVRGPDDWLETTVTFELDSHDGETILRFTHGGFESTTDFMRHCSAKWPIYLIGLKAGLEGGKATPWPTDPRISTWG